MSDTLEPFLLSLPPMLSRDPAFDKEVNEPRILVLVKLIKNNIPRYYDGIFKRDSQEK